MSDVVLEVDALRVEFPLDTGVVRAVDGVSFSVAAGERVAIVGESGSGKTVTALAVWVSWIHRDASSRATSGSTVARWSGSPRTSTASCVVAISPWCSRTR